MLRRLAIVAMCQHMACKVKGESCLTDPLRAFKEQRMMHTPSR